MEGEGERGRDKEKSAGSELTFSKSYIEIMKGEGIQAEIEKLNFS